LDFFGLCSSTLINVMLMRRFGIVGMSDWTWHHLPTLLYFTAGIVQLAVLLLAPLKHQRHRFVINLANRLVKAVTVTWAVSSKLAAEHRCCAQHGILAHKAPTLWSISCCGNTFSADAQPADPQHHYCCCCCC
jgi:hypothetical protein